MNAAAQPTLEDAISAWWQVSGVGVPDPYQLAFLAERRSLVVNKARQTGFSTASACLAVWQAAVGGQKVLILSKDQDASIHVLNDYCPAFIRGLGRYADAKPDTDRKQLIQWPNGGEIRAFPASEEAARGYPSNLVVLDEAAHFTKEEGLDRRIWRALVPTTAAIHGRIVVQSTPNGMGNLFEELWHHSEMAHLQVSWRECPRLSGFITSEDRWGERVYWVGGTPFNEADFLQEFENRFDVASNEAIPLRAIWAAEDATVETWDLPEAK